MEKPREARPRGNQNYANIERSEASRIRFISINIFKMTTTAKIGIALVIILVVIMLGWTWFNNSTPKAEEVANTNIVAEITPTPTPQLPNTAGTGMSDEKDLSVEAIQTDLDAVGKQMTGLSEDTAGIDYGLNIVIK